MVALLCPLHACVGVMLPSSRAMVAGTAREAKLTADVAAARASEASQVALVQQLGSNKDDLGTQIQNLKQDIKALQSQVRVGSLFCLAH